MMKKRNILITAIGSFSADCAVRELKRAGHNVWGCDIYPSEWHAVSKELIGTYQVPLATDRDNYVEALLKVANDNAIQYIIPLTDVEIDTLNLNRDAFVSKGITLCMPSKETLAIARDKYALYKMFKDDSIVPTVPTYKTGVDDIPNCIPCIAKPCNGRSSEGLRFIKESEELDTVKNNENYIVQKFIAGPICTVDYVRDEAGNDFSVSREELLRTKNGAGTTVRTFRDEKLIELVSHIGAAINVVGTINMEFIKHENDYYLIDINPRFSAGVAFSVVAGYNMVLNHLNCHFGKKVDAGTIYHCGLLTKRYHEEKL